MHGKRVLIKHDLLQNANSQNLYCYKIFFLLLVLSAVEGSEKRLNIVKAIMLLITFISIVPFKKNLPEDNKQQEKITKTYKKCCMYKGMSIPTYLK